MDSRQACGADTPPRLPLGSPAAKNAGASDTPPSSLRWQSGTADSPLNALVPSTWPPVGCTCHYRRLAGPPSTAVRGKVSPVALPAPNRNALSQDGEGMMDALVVGVTGVSSILYGRKDEEECGGRQTRHGTDGVLRCHVKWCPSAESHGLVLPVKPARIRFAAHCRDDPPDADRLVCLTGNEAAGSVPCNRFAPFPTPYFRPLLMD